MKLKCTFLTILLVAMISVPVAALIKIDVTMEDVFNKKTTASVSIGKVVDIAADSRVLNVKIDDTIKGKSPGEKIRVQIAAPEEFLKQVSPDQPLVLFISDPPTTALVHVADTWLLANAIQPSNLTAWRVVQIWDTLRPAFPGRTSALVKIVNELAENKSTLLNKWEHRPFAAGFKKRAKLDVQKPTWLLAEDLNGDKKPDLLVGTPAGTKLLLASGDGYQDASAQGAWGNSGGYHATGDVNGDGKPDVLLDGTLYLNQGQKFEAAKTKFEVPAKGTPLAATIADVNGDQKPDVLLLSSSGELRIYENPGAADKPWAPRATKPLWTDGDAAFAAFGDWGDTGKLHVIAASKSGIVRYALDADGGAPADLLRLTGVDIKKNEKFKDGLGKVFAVALRVNDAARTDLLTISEHGALLLVNRGFGAYFLDEGVGENLKPKDGAPALSPAAVWTRADLQGKGVDDLLVIGEDGTLYEIDSQGK